MKGLSVLVSLQNKHAWPLRIVWIILYQNGGPQAINSITHAYPVRGEFIVSMHRYVHFTARDQCLDSLGVLFNLFLTDSRFVLSR